MRSLKRGGVRELLRVGRNVWRATAPASNPLPEPFRAESDSDYAKWVDRHDKLTSSVRLELLLQDAAFAIRPKISIIMPTYNTNRDWLCDAIESVRAQTYANWELCIADDASTEPHVREVLDKYASIENRLRVKFRETNGHICAATNSALELAAGDWIALLDHDDVLAPDALFWVAKVINDNPGAQMIYSDEDKIDQDFKRFGAYFKPAWDRHLFLGQNMFSHLGLFKADLVRQVGGFREGYEGSQDYDLALRCAEHVHPSQIIHIPRVLYHWRVHEQSTAHSHDAKPYAITAGVRAVQDHFHRTNVRAICEQVRAGFHIKYCPEEELPIIAVILAGSVLGEVLKDGWADRLLRTTDYPPARLRLFMPLQMASSSESSQGMVEASTFSSLSILMAEIAAARIPLVCFIDPGLEPASKSWLREMAGAAMQEGVGAVGPKITRGATIESTGIVFLPGPPLRPSDAHHMYPSDALGYFGRAQLTHSSSAVRSVCVVVRTALLAGLDVESVFAGEFDGGVELSRHVRAAAFEVISAPAALVEARQKLKLLPPEVLWPEMVEDPAYSPNLSALKADFSLAWPPRVTPVRAGRT